MRGTAFAFHSESLIRSNLVLFDSLTSAPDPTRPAVVTPSATTTWQDLLALISHRREQLNSFANQTVAIALPPTADGIATLAALDGLQTSAYLLDAQLSHADQVTLARRFNIPSLLTAPATTDASWQNDALASPNSATNSVATVTIMTSGTEGQPKAAAHNWETLARPVRRGAALSEHRWLLSYRIQLYAGLQVALQALLNHGTLIIPTPGCPPDEVVTLMATGQTTHASATPSYWRRLLFFSDRTNLSSINLRQITLGGEATDQQLLDSLNECFPTARIAHIYATTELGRCFSVTDGRAGFPSGYLNGPTDDGVELRITDDQLFVRSANAMRGYQQDSAKIIAKSDSQKAASPNDWFPTGDLVQQDGDRIHFAGRATEMINVGGNKVRPLQVESIIRTIPGVVDVRVYAKQSSIAGQLVACQIVPAPDHPPETLKQTIASTCTDRLAPYQRPRFIEIVSQINLTAAGKTKR